MKKNRFEFMVSFVVLLLLGILMIPSRIEAASYQKVDNKCKVAGKYFWNDDGKIMVSKIKDSNGECIQENINYSFITNGEIVYFIKGYEQDAINLYKINADGTGEKYIKKLKHAGNISGCYGNEIYYERHGRYNNNECDETLIHEYAYNIETGKIKKVVDNCCFRESYKQYFIGKPNAGDYSPSPLILYNAKLEKEKVITQGDLGAYLQENKLYFADVIKKGNGYIYNDKSATWETSIKSYDLKTKKIKTLVEKIKICSIYKINFKEVIYSASDKQGELQYYKYNYKTSKKRKIANLVI